MESTGMRIKRSRDISGSKERSKTTTSIPLLRPTTFPAFAAPSIAFCADPAPALPDLNEIPVGLSPAEIAQLHRETEENAAQCGRLLQEICGQAKICPSRQERRANSRSKN
ncbi:hypothetical protein HAX54_043931 [Datura stramonium]|uniref:Uncharacterized protein n=1 Tax=Datura stramonium TaxID=4076 RepID=A0ABS8W3T1_DATST|nr:hypothetical protein [Datura stramonium]